MRCARLLLVSVAVHLAAIAFVAWTVVKPLFLPLWIAALILVALFSLVAAARVILFGEKGFRCLGLGVIVSVFIFLAFLTLMDWVVGTPPGQQASLSGLAQYSGNLRPKPAVVAFYSLPFLLAAGSTALGRQLGVWWKLKRSKPI